jgi:hypothetical protein
VYISEVVERRLRQVKLVHIVSDHEEEKLAAKGRLVKENNFLWIASRVLNRVEDGRGPRRL